MHLVTRRVPATESQPEKSKKGLYQIDDHFLRFWFRFVHPHQSGLDLGLADAILEQRIKPELDHFAAAAFEEAAQAYIARKAQSGGLPFLPERIGSWWSREAEIDVLAISQAEKTALVGECKWSINPVGTDILDDLKRKSQLLTREYGIQKIQFALFARCGLPPGLRKQAREEGVGLYYARIFGKPPLRSRLRLHSRAKRPFCQFNPQRQPGGHKNHMPAYRASRWFIRPNPSGTAAPGDIPGPARAPPSFGIRSTFLAGICFMQAARASASSPAQPRRFFIDRLRQRQQQVARQQRDAVHNDPRFSSVILENGLSNPHGRFQRSPGGAVQPVGCNSGGHFLIAGCGRGSIQHGFIAFQGAFLCKGRFFPLRAASQNQGCAHGYPPPPAGPPASYPGHFH